MAVRRVHPALIALIAIAVGNAAWMVPAAEAKAAHIGDGIRTVNGRDFSDDTTEFISALFSPTVILTQDNFKSVISTAFTDAEAEDMSGPVIVSFFDPKCPHCRKFMPHYSVMARYFYDHNPERISTKGIGVFAVDCDASGFLCSKFNIDHYPEVMFGTQKEFLDVFGAGSTAERYLYRLSIVDKDVVHKVVHAGFHGNGAFYLVNQMKREFDIQGECPPELDKVLLEESPEYSMGKYAMLDKMTDLYRNQNDGEAQYLMKKVRQRNNWKNSGKLSSLSNADGNDIIKVTMEIFKSLTLPKGPQKRSDLKEFLGLLSLAHPTAKCKEGAQRLLDNFESSVWPEDSDMPLPSATEPSVDGSISMLDICLDEAEPGSYRSCEGSKPFSRGFSCGLWTLFHTLSVNIPEVSTSLTHPGKVVLSGVKAFVRSYFSCQECRDHFIEMTDKSPEFKKVFSKEDAIVWLWWAHNRVNLRLSIEEARAHQGDPYFPKIFFPSKEKCEACYNTEFGANDRLFDYEDNSYNFSGLSLRHVKGFLTRFYMTPTYGSRNLGASSQSRNNDRKKKEKSAGRSALLYVGAVVVVAGVVFMIMKDASSQKKDSKYTL